MDILSRPGWLANELLSILALSLSRTRCFLLSPTLPSQGNESITPALEKTFDVADMDEFLQTKEQLDGRIQSRWVCD